MIADLDHKVVERFLATPASRFSIVLSQIVRSALTAAIQAVVILLVVGRRSACACTPASPAGSWCILVGDPRQRGVRRDLARRSRC